MDRRTSHTGNGVGETASGGKSLETSATTSAGSFQPGSSQQSIRSVVSAREAAAFSRP